MSQSQATRTVIEFAQATDTDPEGTSYLFANFNDAIDLDDFNDAINAIGVDFARDLFDTFRNIRTVSF